MSYQYLKEYLKDYIPVLAVPLAGATAGFLAWVPIYQLDTIKTIYQAQDLQKPEINSYKDLGQYIKENHNIKSLSRGFWVAANRSIIVSSVGLLVWEEVLSFLQTFKRNTLE